MPGHNTRTMSSSDCQASFKAGKLTFLPVSIILAFIAIIIPIYLYPAFFINNFLGLFPYVILLIFIFYYDRERYLRLATIQIFSDRIHIIKKTEKNSFRFSEITGIEKKPEIGKKLFVISMQDGRKIGLYDRRIHSLGNSFINIIIDRSRKDIAKTD